MHRIAITQATHPGRGREFYQRKRDEGKREGEARRSLKRHIIDLVFVTITADTERAQRSPGRQVGATRESSAAGQSPTANTSERSVPGAPKADYNRRRLTHRGFDLHRLGESIILYRGVVGLGVL
jgi:hypothetical protein